jgi:hypothetical protein
MKAGAITWAKSMPNLPRGSGRIPVFPELLISKGFSCVWNAVIVNQERNREWKSACKTFSFLHTSG